MSGLAARRCHIAATSANVASAAATAATRASQKSARRAGGGRRRTGRRSAASASIRRSYESSISISAMHLEAQCGQRPMQVHLERSLAAARQHRGIAQRFLLKHEMVYRLALALRQFRECRADPLGSFLVLDPSRKVDGFVGMALVGQWCMHFALAA